MTLLELMVAVILFVGGLLALTQVSMVVSDVHRIDETRGAVAQEATEQLFEVENTAFVDIAATHHGRGFTVRKPGAEGELLRLLPDDPDGLPGRIEVEAIDELNTGIHMWRVSAIVEWEGRRGPETFTRQTLVSRYGVHP